MPLFYEEVSRLSDSRVLMSQFFRFPHTPHIKWLGEGSPRGDKVLSQQEVADLLSGVVTVEEKVDGANVGISFDGMGQLRIQNRGQYLVHPFRGQFSRMSAWLAEHEDGIRRVLKDDIILFGEWCVAVHSVAYDRLPDWFLLFDVYDRSQRKFYSVNRRNELCARTGLSVVPEIHRGKVRLSDLLDVMGKNESRVGSDGLEGVVVRKDCADWNLARGKLVKRDFVQAIEAHWSRAPLRWNRLSST